MINSLQTVRMDDWIDRVERVLLLHISGIKESFLLAIISEETTLQSHSLDFGSFDVVYEEHKSLEDPFRVSGAKGVCLTGRSHKNGNALSY